MRFLTAASAAWIACQAPLLAQVHTFPYSETFDTLVPPALPAGWQSSQNRSAGTDDFVSVTSSPFSAPNAVLSTNATVGQTLVSPAFDFHGLTPDSLLFFLRRSSTHTATVVIDISQDDGASYPITLSDSLHADATGEYRRYALLLPQSLAWSAGVRVRWRVVPGAGGATGTLRIDDVTIRALFPADITVTGVSLTVAEPAEIGVELRNLGTENLSGARASVFLDADGDSLATLPEEIGSGALPSVLTAGSSAVLRIAVPPLPPGPHQVIAVAGAEGDLNPFNDSLTTTIQVPFNRSSVVINEIMYQPLSGGSEYVELFNPGAFPIDLTGWVLSDRPGSDGEANEVPLGGTNGPLGPAGFLLVGSDSLLRNQFASIPAGMVVIPGGTLTLNNDGDCLLLTDPSGSTVDSIPYLPDWHHSAVLDVTGRSLERLSFSLPGEDPTNWSTCTLPPGGSPGAANSISVNIPHEPATLSLNPNPFSPDGDGFEDFTLISFNLPGNAFAFSVRLFDTEGRQIRQLATYSAAGRTGAIVWDGRDDSGRKARIGMYVVLLEIHSPDGGTMEARKGVLVVAGRL